MAKRHSVSGVDHETIRTLVARHGLRPVVNAVGKSARELAKSGIPVLNEFHEPMDKDNIRIAAENLCNGDLY